MIKTVLYLKVADHAPHENVVPQAIAIVNSMLGPTPGFRLCIDLHPRQTDRVAIHLTKVEKFRVSCRTIGKDLNHDDK